MKKIKYLLIVSIILGGLFFLFSRETFPDNLQFNKFINSNPQDDVIIIFNSGGWGNTPLERADDFLPIAKGIQETLNEWGYNSIIVPYNRTKDSFLGTIGGIKGTIFSFQNQTEKLSGNIEDFLKENPGKKIIITGLSNGAAFANEIMEKLSKDKNSAVFAIEVGTPFWEKTSNSEDILVLNNEGKDPLVKGDIKILFSTILKMPLRWFWAKISGKNINFSRAFYMPNHAYSWADVKPEVNSFLEEKLK